MDKRTNEILNYILLEQVVIKAQIKALEIYVGLVADHVAPEQSNEYLRVRDKLDRRLLDDLLISHPLLKEGFDDLLRLLRTDDQT